jgi:hypothetical protein
MTRPKMLVASVLIGAALAVSPLGASDFTGVYAIVEKVVPERLKNVPDTSDDRRRIQIWGVFALAEGRGGSVYKPAERGYLYYLCPEGKMATCGNEWSDLKSVAGTGQVVGFGARFLENGRVRKADEEPSAPDVYPIQMGVFKRGPAHILADLEAALARK